MDEAYFWLALEYRICGEFAGMPHKELRRIWCDGIIPSLFLLDDPTPRITGQAWLCFGRQQQEWEFTLLLPTPASSREQIDWAALLPPENVTRWISLDRMAKHIEFAPGAAVPDLG
jgi:hypothetical protein